MDDICFSSAHQLAGDIRSGRQTSMALVQAYLQQIKKHNQSLNAIIRLFEKEALALALQRDEEASHGKFVGPLHGVPVTIKEQFWIKGKPSTINAKLFKDFVAPEDAVIVKRIKDSGAIILGQTNIPKLLLDYQVWGDFYPVGNNPYDVSRTPGGSTGGGAAALAAGMTSLELGADLGGSVRVPANFCGLYGLKPTDNTVPRQGNVPLLPSMKSSLITMAQAGPLARTIEDVELLWNIIHGPWAGERDIAPIAYRKSSKSKLTDFRIGCLTGWPEYPSSSSITELIEGVADDLRNLGCEFAVDLPIANLHDESLKLWTGNLPYIVGLEAPFIMRQFMKNGQKKTLFRNYTHYLPELNRGYQLKARHFGELRLRKNRITAGWAALFNHCDVLICPMGYGPAFVHTSIGNPISYEGVEMPYGKYIWPFVACFNASGHPSVNVPLGLNKDGLPVGIQVAGKYWSEPDLIQFVKLLGAEGISGFVRPEGY